MKRLLTILGILSLSSTAWASNPHCTKMIGSAALVRAAQILSADGIDFGTATVTVGDKRVSVGASGGELWIIQLQIEVDKRSYQKIEYISFDQHCRVNEPPDQLRAI